MAEDNKQQPGSSSSAMKRIQCNDITSTLVTAMEEVEEFDHIIILYEKKNGNTGFFHAGEATNANLNWMVDRFKLWLLGALRNESES